jgi:outer membrane biosynthesis protein TonB
MLGFAPLIAAQFALPAVDWQEVVVPLVVFVIWIINQISGANKGKNPPGPRPVAGGGANPKQAKGPLEEVEQFLREARKAMETQQRGQQPQPQAQQRPPQRLVPPQKPQQKQQNRPQKPGGKKADKSQPQPPRKTLAEQSRLKPQAADRELDEIRLGSSVGRHVQEHLGNNKFEERAGRLSHIKQSVEQDIGSHVKSVFDHQIGSLAVQRDAVADASAAEGIATDAGNPAMEIVAMLGNPHSLRQAIILQEILQPPTHRW